MKFPAFEPIELKNISQSHESINIELSLILPDHNQHRKSFNEDSLVGLAASIRQYGVIQPILVMSLGNGSQYQIIAGERRWRAAKIAGLEFIPAIIRKSDIKSNLAISLIENIQRENLNPLEEALALQSLLEECLMTHDQIAKSIGKSRTSVTNFLRLLTLCNEVKHMISTGQIEMGHARAILSLTCEQQIHAANLIVSNTLSVRETEKLVRKIISQHSPQATRNVGPFEEKINKWNSQLSKHLSTEVNVILKKNGEGRIIVNVSSPNDIEWIIEILKGRLL